MCVAVIVESDKRIPAEYLQAMADHNPDGGGVAWVDGDHIQYRKGLTWEEINQIQDMLPRPFFMHFRIATRGAKIPELTHPFPLGMQAFSDDLVGFAKSVLIHNGTWNGYRAHVPNGIDANKVSDTQTAAFVAETNENILKDVVWSNAVMHARGNGKCDIIPRGNWQEFEGNYYSNFHWKIEVEYQRNFQEWKGRHIANSNLIARKKGSHQQNRNQENGRKRRDTIPVIGPRGGSVCPVEGYYDTGKYSSAMGGNYATRALQNTNEFKGPETAYDRAMKNYKESLGRQPSHSAYEEFDYGTESRATQGWEDEPLFSQEELRGSSKSIKCDDCKEEIKTIPCQCGNESVADNAVEISIEDLTEEERETLGIEFLPSDGIPLPIEREYSSGPIDMNDVEDMNAEGLTYELEEPDNNIILSGDTPEDWAKVDAYIRAQGIKI